jgi:hypothetical protein
MTSQENNEERQRQSSTVCIRYVLRTTEKDQYALVPRQDLRPIYLGPWFVCNTYPIEKLLLLKREQEAGDRHLHGR